MQDGFLSFWMNKCRDGEPLRKSLSPKKALSLRFFSLESLSPSLSLFGRFSTGAQALLSPSFFFPFQQKKGQKEEESFAG
jgi:hypothetical protein